MLKLDPHWKTYMDLSEHYHIICESQFAKRENMSSQDVQVMRERPQRTYGSYAELYNQAQMFAYPQHKMKEMKKCSEAEASAADKYKCLSVRISYINTQPNLHMLAFYVKDLYKT